MDSKPKTAAEVEALYHACAAELGSAFERLATGYESDPDRRRDLVQEIHTALWRSLGAFDGRCALRTWAYRVAHNIGASHVARSLRDKSRNWVDLENADLVRDAGQNENAANQRILLDRLLVLIHRLNPIDRQLILLYLEGLDSAAIAGIAGVSPTNVTTKIHRIKKILAQQFQKGGESHGIIRSSNAVGMAVAADDRVETACLEPAS